MKAWRPWPHNLRLTRLTVKLPTPDKQTSKNIKNAKQLHEIPLFSPLLSHCCADETRIDRIYLRQASLKPWISRGTARHSIDRICTRPFQCWQVATLSTSPQSSQFPCHALWSPPALQSSRLAWALRSDSVASSSIICIYNDLSKLLINICLYIYKIIQDITWEGGNESQHPIYPYVPQYFSPRASSPRNPSCTYFSPIYFPPRDSSPRNSSCTYFNPETLLSHTFHPYTFHPETPHPETLLAHTFHIFTHILFTQRLFTQKLFLHRFFIQRLFTRDSSPRNSSCTYFSLIYFSPRDSSPRNSSCTYFSPIYFSPRDSSPRNPSCTYF